jgi:hypothetical protein
MRGSFTEEEPQDDLSPFAQRHVPQTRTASNYSSTTVKREALDKVSFVCPVSHCDKIYKRKGDLKFHVIHKHPEHVHLPGQIAPPKSQKAGKDFPCPVVWCKCGFLWERDLRRHVRVKHSNNINAPPPPPSPIKKTKIGSRHSQEEEVKEGANWTWMDFSFAVHL